MKRLLKTGKLEYGINNTIALIKRIKQASAEDPSQEFAICEAIDDLLLENAPRKFDPVVDYIKNNDKDCLYSGPVYRKLYFKSDFLNDLPSNTREGDNVFVNCKELLDYLKKQIKTGFNQSCSKSLEACKSISAFDLCISMVEPVTVLIEINAKDGIDIMKLCDKYAKLFEEYIKQNPNNKKNKEFEKRITYLKESIRYFSSEQEVFTYVPSDYKILEISNTNIEEFMYSETLNALNLMVDE